MKISSHRWIPMKLWKLHRINKKLRLMRRSTQRLPLRLIRNRKIILVWLNDRNHNVYRGQPDEEKQGQWPKQLEREVQREQRAQQAHCQLGPSLLNGPWTQEINTSQEWEIRLQTKLLLVFIHIKCSKYNNDKTMTTTIITSCGLNGQHGKQPLPAAINIAGNHLQQYALQATTYSSMQCRRPPAAVLIAGDHL